MIRAVFFDLDGTLYDRDGAIVRMAEQQFEAFYEELKHIEKAAFVEHLVALDLHGHNRTPRIHHVLGETLGFSESVADHLEDYFRHHYPLFCTPTEDTRQTLETLKLWGMKTGIVTNGPEEWQRRKVESTGLVSLFDTILISGREGVEKPDYRIFARAMENCGVAAPESVFIGDHPEKDIGGAKGAGMLPVWKRVPYWDIPKDVPSVDQLSEILTLVKSDGT